jgi:hypothetical protein
MTTSRRYRLLLVCRRRHRLLLVCLTAQLCGSKSGSRGASAEAGPCERQAPAPIHHARCPAPRLLCWNENIHPTLSFTSGPKIFRAPNADRFLRSPPLSLSPSAPAIAFLPPTQSCCAPAHTRRAFNLSSLLQNCYQQVCFAFFGLHLCALDTPASFDRGVCARAQTACASATTGHALLC